MPATSNADINDLEDGLTAASPSLSPSRNSARSSSASLQLQNNDHARAATMTNQHDPMQEMVDTAAADTADGHSFQNHRPSLLALQASSSQRLAMDEFIQSRSNNAWENLVESFRQQARISRVSTSRTPEGHNPPAENAGTAGNVPHPELIDNASSLPLSMDIVEEGFSKGSIIASVAKIPPSTGPNAINPTAASASRGASARPSGLELVDDECGPPLPIGMFKQYGDDNEDKKRCGITDNSIEQLSANTNLVNELIPPSPFSPFQLEGITDADAKKKASMPTNSVNELSPPTPFNPSLLETDADAKKKASMPTNRVNELSPPTPFNPSLLETSADADAKKQASMPTNRDSLIVPTREDIEDDDYDQPLTTRFDASRWIRGSDEQVPPSDNHLDIDSVRSENENTIDAGVSNDENTIDAGVSNDDEYKEIPHIPEAVLVEEHSDDGTVIAGVPILPWWKQRRTKLMLGAFLLLLVILSLSLGLPLSRKAPATTTLVFNTESPSQSNLPSFQPSGYPTENPSIHPSITASPSDHPSDPPSASLVPTTGPSNVPTDVPSSSPSACVDQISSNARKIDLVIDDPFLATLEVAIDGKSMIAVVRQREWTGPVFIIFYTLVNEEWQRVNVFLESRPLTRGHSVALSGNAAFVGFSRENDGAGAVSVYEKDQYGDWSLVKDPFIHAVSSNEEDFGENVDIDGDLACVTYDHGTRIYRRENSKLIQFGSVRGSRSCSISGDTIAAASTYSGVELYRYNQDLNAAVEIQRMFSYPDDVRSIDLDNDYLLCWARFKGEVDAFLYHREETKQPFTFYQRFNITGSYYTPLALDNDILVVRDDNGKTHIFSEQTDGNWEETITLDQGYNSYALSGRRLLAISGSGAYYFNIEGCSQAMPTQTPSLSSAPSSSLSPNTRPEPTKKPTNVYRPTPEPTTKKPTPKPTTQSPASSSPPSISPSPTLIPTSSLAPIPAPTLDPTLLPTLSPTITPTLSATIPSPAPSSSSSPSMSSSPTSAPSFSSPPTETCFWIQVAITYDNYADETSWDLQRVVGNGSEHELVKSHRGSDGDQSYVESLCLQEAEYIFTIHDDYGDGICCEYGKGNYDITSKGLLIVEGGEFEESKSTFFSIPSPTSAPTFSTPPTETCIWIQVAITYDDFADETSWDLQRVVGNGSEHELVKSHQGSDGDTSSVESLCLQEAEYIFTIHDYCGDGIFSPGNYNITSEGLLIVEGGKFGESESTSFSIPFVLFS